MKNVIRVVSALMMVVMLVLSVSAASFTADIECKELPSVIPVQNENKELSGALFCTHKRVENGSLTEDEVEITSVEEARKSDDHQRLLDAYENLKATPLEELVDGIDEALSRKSTTMKVSDLVVHDLFDLTSDAEAKELLDVEEGQPKNYVTITFATSIPENQLMFVIQNYEDDKWELIPDEMLVHKNGSIVAVTVDKLAPLAFLVPGGIADVPQKDADFVPSVEFWTFSIFREILEGEDEDRIIAVVEDPEEKVVSKAKTGEMTVRPYAYITEEDAADELSDAYEQLANVENLEDLVPGVGEQLSQLVPGADASDLVIRDLFEIELSGEAGPSLAQEGNTITLTFEIGLKADEALIVLHNYEGDKWEAIPNSDVVCYPNGNVNVTFEDLSPIAFAVAPIPAEEEPEETEAVTETETAEETEAPAETIAPTEESSEEAAPSETDEKEDSNILPIILIVLAAVVILIIVIILIARKKNKKDKK